jgi:hypothetical protein
MGDLTDGSLGTIMEESSCGWGIQPWIEASGLYWCVG